MLIPEDWITGSTILGLLGNTRIVFVKKLNKIMFKIIVAEISMLLILSSLSSFDIYLSTSAMVGSLVLVLFNEETLLLFLPKSGGARASPASQIPSALLSDD